MKSLKQLVVFMVQLKSVKPISCSGTDKIFTLFIYKLIDEQLRSAQRIERRGGMKWRLAEIA